MDLNQVAVFVRVAETGSFTKAAAQLRLPKSRVSRRVAALERALGVPLLYRTTRQTTLTERGRRLYEQCREPLLALEMATQATALAAPEVAGLLRVTATPDIGKALLGPVVDEFHRTYPRARVELCLADHVVDLTAMGIDLALRVGRLRSAMLRTRPLGSVAFVLVASPGYLRGAPKLRRLQDLTRHQTLEFETATGAGKWTLVGPRGREESVAVQPRSRANEPGLLLRLAVAGHGVALLPSFLCAEALASGELERVLPGHATKPKPIQFVWPLQKEESASVAAFVQVARKHLAGYFGDRG